MIKDNPFLPNREYIPNWEFAILYQAFLEQNKYIKLTNNTNNIVASELENIDNSEAEESFQKLLLKRKKLN